MRNHLICLCWNLISRKSKTIQPCGACRSASFLLCVINFPLGHLVLKSSSSPNNTVNHDHYLCDWHKRTKTWLDSSWLWSWLIWVQTHMIRFTTLSLFYLLLLCQLVAALVSEGTDTHAGGVPEAPPCEMWPSLLDRFALVHSVSVSAWPRAPEITFSSVLFFIRHYLWGENNKTAASKWGNSD